jgi:sialidase-1
MNEHLNVNPFVLASEPIRNCFAVLLAHARDRARLSKRVICVRTCVFVAITIIFGISLPANAFAVECHIQESVDAENASTSAPVSFEQSKPGRFDMLETSIGTWRAGSGIAMVDGQHAKTGAQCLQLAGGEPTSVILDVADDADTSGQLTFWAERWTSRPPFSFRIEKFSGGEWSEIFDGDKQVRVGRSFLSHVKVPLGDTGIRRLRFSVSSPANTGVLIDDVRLTAAVAQKITTVDLVPLTLPALVGVDRSAVVKLKVETTGSLNPIALTELLVTLQESDSASDSVIESVQVICGDALKTAQAFDEARSAAGQTKFTGGTTLLEGANHFWLVVKLRSDADIDQHIGAKIDAVGFSNGQTVRLDEPFSTQRLGVALRNGGDDGVHTFRIPGLATSNRGTLIGVYDVRRQSGRDLPGDIDVGMSRSTDGGRTWESLKIIMDMGDDPKWSYDGIGDPAILVDKNTGTIWVAATWSHGNRSWVGSGPGLQPEETGQLMLGQPPSTSLRKSSDLNGVFCFRDRARESRCAMAR